MPGLPAQGWTRKALVTIAAAAVGTGGVTGYSAPLATLMLSAATRADILANAQADLRDLRVTLDEDGELEIGWDKAVGTKAGGFAVGVFGRAGTLSASTVTGATYWLWWGNPTAAATNGTLAYDLNWEMYNPNGGVGTNRITGTTYGTAVGGLTSGGEVGPFGVDTLATDYNGSTQWVDFGTTPTSQSGANNRTQMCWVFSDAVTMNKNLWVNVFGTGGNTVVMTQVNGTPDTLRVFIGTDNRSGPAIAAGQWQFLSFCLDGTTVGDIDLQVDGTISTFVSGGVIVNTPANSTSYFGFSGGTAQYGGLAAELQQHKLARSAAWRITEFNAGSDPAAFASSGDPVVVEFAGGPAWVRGRGRDTRRAA